MSHPKGYPGSSTISLPSEDTDAGAMARLFIAEVEVPENGDMREARLAMDWMRCVLMNRLKYPADFGADKHTTRIVDIITAKGYGVQFRGFENYPNIDRAQEGNIDDKINAATASPSPDQKAHDSFIKTAIAAATEASPVDPTATGLYYCVSSTASSPNSQAVLFQELGGNKFYTWKRPDLKKRETRHANHLIPTRNGPLIYDHKRPAPRRCPCSGQAKQERPRMRSSRALRPSRRTSSFALQSQAG